MATSVFCAARPRAWSLSPSIDLYPRLHVLNAVHCRLLRRHNQIIYDENDVQIRTIPAIHAIEGP